MQPFSGAGCLILGLNLRQSLYYMYVWANSEGFGETAWAFSVRIYDKYQSMYAHAHMHVHSANSDQPVHNLCKHSQSSLAVWIGFETLAIQTAHIEDFDQNDAQDDFSIRYVRKKKWPSTSLNHIMRIPNIWHVRKKQQKTRDQMNQLTQSDQRIAAILTMYICTQWRLRSAYESSQPSLAALSYPKISLQRS